MLTPADIRNKTLRAWSRGTMLRAEILAEPFFPLRIPWGRPSAKVLREDFSQVRNQVNELQNWCRSSGPGCTIQWREINHRLLGRQQVPEAVLLDRQAFLHCCGKTREYNQFTRDLALVRKRCPKLLDRLAAHPLDLVRHAGKWPELLAVVDWFRAHPRPGLYLRQLDIPGVDTKFIEQEKKILAVLLEQVLPPSAIDPEVKGLARHRFERRFGLNHDQARVRLRFLDQTRAPHPGCLDLELPLSGLVILDPPVGRVIITENKINGLCFPPLADALVIFGLGYGVQSLAEIPWLRDRDIFYWGDIDTHGFSILSLLRSFLPQTRSFLMDRETLAQHRELWGEEEQAKRCLHQLNHLDHREQALFEALKTDALGRRIRLEQERIRFSKVAAAVQAINLAEK